jgi:hypothetical protein
VALSHVAAVQDMYAALAAQLQGSMLDFMAELEATGSSFDALRQKLQFLAECKAQVDTITAGQVI